MLEYDYEPTPGMPQALPEDERVIWRGPAKFKSLACSTFHVRKLAVYFAVLIGLNLGYGLTGATPVTEMLASAMTFTVLAIVALGVLTLYARLVARATLYTVTTRRIVIRSGVAVPVTVNLPFSKIERAALRTHKDGSGDIALVPDLSSRASYVLLWPLVKPFRFLRVQPVLRGIADAENVATLLAGRLSTDAIAVVPEQDGVEVPAPSKRRPKLGKLWVYPTLPLAAATSLVIFALLAVSWEQLTDPGDGNGIAAPAALASVGLYFDDKEDGSVLVIDADSGATLDTLEPGSNGFLRSAMRTFVNARRALDIGRETPFVLARMPNGQLLLTDPATDRQIDLRAFGATNADAFGRFLELAAAGSVVDANVEPNSDVQPAPTAVALSNQEVHP